MAPHRIAIVDDAPEVRSLVRTRVRLQGGFTVVGEGGTGSEAITIAEREQPDLLLLDVSMPGMGGLDALEHIRRVAPGTRVVLYSGFEEEGLRARAEALGAAAFVQKSGDVAPLLDTLTDVMSDRPLPDDEPAAGSLRRATAGPEDEAILTEHVERFRAVFERAAIGIGTVTLTGQIVRGNAALAELLGRDVADLVGLHLQDVVPAAERDVVGYTVATSLEHGVAQVEHHVSGQVRSVLSTLAVVQDSASRPLYLLLQSQDVSAQRAAERALVESEERFRLLVDSVADYAIFMLDAEGRIASWNRGAERLKGYRADEILGRHFRTFYEPHAQESRHPEYELEVATHAGRYEEEGWRIRKDGTRFWANVVITALRGATGELVGFAKVTRDVTRRRQAAQELEDSAAALAEANVRLGEAAEERANFLAITAHELRSPLAVVAGTSQTLRAHWDRLDPAERDELLASAEASADRMRRMLDELLLAARLDAGRLQPHLADVRVDELLAAVATSQVAALAADVALECPPGLVVRTDADQLTQVVTNFVTNAVRHGAAPVTVRARTAADRVEVVVEDHGPGLPAGVAAEVFGQMFLTGGSRRGTGLGLYIVRRLARTLGGDVWYERGDGTTRFGVWLPAGAAGG